MNEKAPPGIKPNEENPAGNNAVQRGLQAMAIFAKQKATGAEYFYADQLIEWEPTQRDRALRDDPEEQRGYYE